MGIVYATVRLSSGLLLPRAGYPFLLYNLDTIRVIVMRRDLVFQRNR